MIILANTGIFLYIAFFKDHAQSVALINAYGLVPDAVRLDDISNLHEFRTHIIRPFFTNMFLHGGWGHILSNMWFLYIFGDNVEDRMGKVRYFLFYILCGLTASITHFILYRNSMAPAIGASGAISGVMAAYMLMFPKSTIISFIPIFIIPLLFPIPAIIFIGIWFIGQLLTGTTMLMLSDSATGIAFWAHIGGFLGGVWLYRYFVSGKRRKSYA